MFWKRKCKHDWHLLDSKEEYITYHIVGVPNTQIEKRSYIYCPKCDKRDVVSADEWRRIERAQSIKRQYSIDEK